MHIIELKCNSIFQTTIAVVGPGKKPKTWQELATSIRSGYEVIIFDSDLEHIYKQAIGIVLAFNKKGQLFFMFKLL